MAVLGRTEIEVPRLGLGAMTWGDPKGLARLHPAKTAYGGAESAVEEAQAVSESLAAGVTLIDTAATYSGGAAELRLGELVAGKAVTVASKFPRGFFGFRADKFEEELRGSLTRLGRSKIELYQHHFPGPGTSIPDLMGRMADAVEAGKIGAIGVSNYSAAQMREAHAALAKRNIPLASNQVQYSLLYRRPEVDGVLGVCRELGVTLIAYSPLAMGMLSGKYSGDAKATGLRRLLPNFSRRGREAAAPVVNLLRQIGERHGKTAGQVALRWLIENPVVLPIPGAKNGRQARENAGALGWTLAPDEVEALDRASAAWRK
ncbi:MAG: aldo/keto reductase [Devosia sp.]